MVSSDEDGELGGIFRLSNDGDISGQSKVPWAPGPIVGVRSVDMVDFAKRMAWVKACDSGKGAKFEAVNHTDWSPTSAEVAAFEALRKARNSIVERDRAMTIDSIHDIAARAQRTFDFCSKTMIANAVRHVATDVDRLEQCSRWGQVRARDARIEPMLALLRQHAPALYAARRR